MATPLIPKLKVPLTMGAHGFETLEQGSIGEVAQCVYAIVATPVGSRIDDMDFGVEDPTFDQLPLDESETVSQIHTYEPEAEVTVTQDITDYTDLVTVEVSA